MPLSTDTDGTFDGAQQFAGDRAPAILVVMGKFGGPSGYHEQSANDARRRIVSFFDRHLSTGD